jgi:hypothetical protein
MVFRGVKIFNITLNYMNHLFSYTESHFSYIHVKIFWSLKLEALTRLIAYLILIKCGRIEPSWIYPANPLESSTWPGYRPWWNWGISSVYTLFGTEKAKTCSNHVCFTRITELKQCVVEQTIVASTVSMDTTRSRLRLSNFSSSIGRPGTCVRNSGSQTSVLPVYPGAPNRQNQVCYESCR